MCIFKARKLQKTIELLEFKNSTLLGERDSLKEQVTNLRQEVTAKRNIIRQQDERIEKMKKRVETQQNIINKQNEKLGTAQKKAKQDKEVLKKADNRNELYDKESDPYIEE